MYFSRVRLNGGELSSEQAADLVCDDAYSAHQLLWRLFPRDPEASRDFLFREDELHGTTVIYLVSNRIPESRGSALLVETKPYAPKLHKGQRLGFSLRANPVITVTDRNGHRARHDVVMNLKLAGRSGASSPQSEVELVQEAGVAWLTARAAKHGCEIDARQVVADGYRQHRLQKDRRGKPIRFSTIDYRGALTVSDTKVFENALFCGIGPAKAFGCGLLLVRKLS